MSNEAGGHQPSCSRGFTLPLADAIGRLCSCARLSSSRWQRTKQSTGVSSTTAERRSRRARTSTSRTRTTETSLLHAAAQMGVLNGETVVLVVGGSCRRSRSPRWRWGLVSPVRRLLRVACEGGRGRAAGAGNHLPHLGALPLQRVKGTAGAGGGALEGAPLGGRTPPLIAQLS